MAQDRDGQPPKAFHYRRNVAKALDSLRGICIGITADRSLNSHEILLLDTWIRDQQHLKSDPDVFDLLDLTGDILADGKVTKAELKDLMGLIDTVLEYGLDSGKEEYDSIELLLGYTKGLIADNLLNDKEIRHLRRWVREARSYYDKWPVSAIAERIESIMADKVITDEEREELLQLLQGIHGGDWMMGGVVSGMTAQLPWDEPDAIEFSGQLFCLTGKFASGPRAKVATRIQELGGRVHNKINRKLDYLVVGVIASRDWKNSTHGLKIQEAMENRSNNYPIKIISEEEFVKHI
jgi:hypothetical protein